MREGLYHGVCKDSGAGRIAVHCGYVGGKDEGSLQNVKCL